MDAHETFEILLIGGRKYLAGNQGEVKNFDGLTYFVDRLQRRLDVIRHSFDSDFAAFDHISSQSSGYYT